jgi:hypothetical protein
MYKDRILCVVVPMHASHLLLGIPWQFDKKDKHDGFKNRYSIEKDERTYTLVSLSPI